MVKRLSMASLVCGVFLLCMGFANAADALLEEDTGIRVDQSLLREVRAAMDKGQAFLKKTQDPAGFWGAKEMPALTGLVVTAYFRDPKQPRGSDLPGYMQKAVDFLASCAQKNGGIFAEGGLTNYNTAVGVMALTASGDPQYHEIIRKARGFLWGHQATDEVHGGGFGYDKDNERLYADMSNTILALEALKVSKMLDKQSEDKELIEKDAWRRAAAFVERCQNLPSNLGETQPVAAGDEGGFFYKPGESKAGEVKMDDDKTALRSYGSMTYAGLLSYIYADLEQDDVRIRAALEWLQKNYSLDENPGMKTSGLYYYYHTMAKCLAATGIDTLEVDGEKIDWRHMLLVRLVSLQKRDGSWANEDNRWWEADPNLVTSYVLMAMSAIVEGYGI